MAKKVGNARTGPRISKLWTIRPPILKSQHPWLFLRVNRVSSVRVCFLDLNLNPISALVARAGVKLHESFVLILKFHIPYEVRFFFKDYSKNSGYIEIKPQKILGGAAVTFLHLIFSNELNKIIQFSQRRTRISLVVCFKNNFELLKTGNESELLNSDMWEFI